MDRRFSSIEGPGQSVKATKDPERKAGQALLEFLILLPVFLLLILAASDLGKLFAISGKCEIAARYSALKVARGQMDPAEVATVVQDRFFRGTLNDRFDEPGDPEDVEETSLSVPHGMTYFDSFPTLSSLPLGAVEGREVRFVYDFSPFPYRKWRLLPRAEGGTEEASSPLQAQYRALGHFVGQFDDFSGASAAEVQLRLLSPIGIIPLTKTVADLMLIVYILFLLLP